MNTNHIPPFLPQEAYSWKILKVIILFLFKYKFAHILVMWEN